MKSYVMAFWAVHPGSSRYLPISHLPLLQHSHKVLPGKHTTMASNFPPPAAFVGTVPSATGAAPSTATATSTTGAPAGAVAAEPAKALDPIAEPDILDKALNIAKPVSLSATTSKPADVAVLRQSGRGCPPSCGESGPGDSALHRCRRGQD